MMNTASNIRAELEKDVNFTLASDSEQTLILKEHLIEKYNKDYDGIIAKEKIQKELDSWIDYI